MTDQHTPGPWTTDVVRFNSYTLRIIKAGTDWIAHVHTQSAESDPPRDVSNARLIEAAPELLQEVEWLLDAYIDAIRAYAVSFKRQPNPEDDRDVIRIRALIAKVRGTQ
jgi:hypothetical protein